MKRLAGLVAIAALAPFAAFAQDSGSNTGIETASVSAWQQDFSSHWSPLAFTLSSEA